MNAKEIKSAISGMAMMARFHRRSARILMANGERDRSWMYRGMSLGYLEAARKLRYLLQGNVQDAESAELIRQTLWASSW